MKRRRRKTAIVGAAYAANKKHKNMKTKKQVSKKVKKIVKKVKKIVNKKAIKKAKVQKSKKARKHESKKAKPVAKAPVGKKIGLVTHFYGNISVGIVKFSRPVVLGAKIHFKGATTDFSQTVDSMQFDHKEIALAPAGQEVGMKVKKKVRQGDEVFESK